MAKAIKTRFCLTTRISKQEKQALKCFVQAACSRESVWFSILFSNENSLTWMEICDFASFIAQIKQFYSHHPLPHFWSMTPHLAQDLTASHTLLACMHVCAAVTHSWQNLVQRCAN